MVRESSPDVHPLVRYVAVSLSFLEPLTEDIHEIRIIHAMTK